MANLRSAISNPRFDGYKLTPSNSDLGRLKRYIWNIALSEALYPTIQFLEIALRNSIHHAATTTFSNEVWFDDPAIITDTPTLRIIGGAKRKLTRENKPIESGRVVAELYFGFWRALFYNEYEQKPWWPIIKDVFPNAPKSMRQRASIAPRNVSTVSQFRSLTELIRSVAAHKRAKRYRL